MGRIKQTPLKRIGDKLISEYKKEFSNDFEKNKFKVQELINVESKTMKNKIAGYITKVMNQEEKLEAKIKAASKKEEKNQIS